MEGWVSKAFAGVHHPILDTLRKRNQTLLVGMDPDAHKIGGEERPRREYEQLRPALRIVANRPRRSRRSKRNC